MTPELLSAPDGGAWDLLVIGGGTAGIVGAKTAAGLGASVLLVERDRTGGDCLWTGCVPSKALLAAAHAAADARRAHRYGVHVDGVVVDFAAVMAGVHSAVASIAPVDSPQALREAGVQVLAAAARMTGPDTAEVDGHPVRWRQVLLATGAAPVRPDISGLDGPSFVTSESIWQRDVLPERLLVLGAGSVGCELGQAFARLGSSVTLLESGPDVLPRETRAAAAVLTAALRADGVDVRTATQVTRFDGSTAHLADGSVVGYDLVLLATGRRARTGGLGLAEAGVDVDDLGQVVVDRQLRTSHPRVWAAGDVTTFPRFTHSAGVFASTAASNAVLGLRRSVDPERIPRVTFTQPEIACAGVTDATAGRRRTERRIEHRHVDRAIIDQHADGFTSLVLGRRGRVLGGTVVGPRAGESLAEITLAVTQGLTVRDLAASMHAYPTYSDGVWNSAIADVRSALGRAPVRWVTAMLAWLHRRRLLR